MKLKQRTAEFRLVNLRLTLANMNDIFTVLELGEIYNIIDQAEKRREKREQDDRAPIGE